MLLVNAVVRWFLPVLLAAVALTILSLWKSTGNPRVHWRSVLAISLPLGIVLASGIKDSESRDFLLAIPLIAALAATALMRFGRSIQSAWSRVVGVIALAASLFLAAHGVVQEEYFSQALEPRIDDIVRTAEEIDKLNVESVWATGYNAWTPESSSVFGLIWSAGSFNDEIRQVSPDARHFDLFGRRILQVNVDGELAPLSCQELQDLAAESGVGVIVESQGHIATDPSSERILLSNATADPVQPSQLGRYFAYPLTGIRCT